MSADAGLHPLSRTSLQEKQRDSSGQSITETGKCLTHPSDLNLNPINQNAPFLAGPDFMEPVIPRIESQSTGRKFQL
ncbi:MAG: hypothetical protein P8J66_06630 [Verrucomicrobiota bacterium]|jgi:hypothetical protein|nr:hypothetical protein [Verrucomicrobiota bacterium]